MVIAPEHELVSRVMDRPEVAEYVEQSGKKSELERSEESRPKDGVFSGLTARHPATGQELPIWISDFVLPGYGTGAIMAVPAHDERDHQFALRYGLPIRPVILPDAEWDFSRAAYTGMEGRVASSDPLDGLTPTAAIPVAIDWLASKGLGERAVSYHLRDWIFSRQHYWGEPIPMIDCQQCGWNPVPEDQLPVLLPEVERYEPAETGESPLANIPGWVDVPCPRCGGPARRETDTMPNWAGSDWYFLRYCDPHNDHAPADMDKLRYWMPVDVYIGGDEHNTLHLLYSRFIYLFLYDLGVVPPEYPEPYRKRLSHGVILGPDGQRMSKSRGNVIVPQEYVEKYGADSVRVYLLFMGPYDATIAWNERALSGVKRFLDRYRRFVRDQAGQSQESGPRVQAAVNRLGKEVADDTASFKYNTAIAHMMETLNRLQDLVESGDQMETVAARELRTFSQILAPYAPFTAEDCWQLAGGETDIHTTLWPVYDPGLELEELVTIAIQVNGKLRGTVAVPPQTAESEIRHQAESQPGIAKFLADKTITRVIYVPMRTMNFVVS
jgi:leucyl-tRNA synthetase